MTDLVLSGGRALLGVARVLLTAARAIPRRRRRFVRPDAAWFGPAWAWCPAEGCETPHGFDVGARRCLVCKTTTTQAEGAGSWMSRSGPTTCGPSKGIVRTACVAPRPCVSGAGAT